MPPTEDQQCPVPERPALGRACGRVGVGGVMAPVLPEAARSY